MIDSAADASVVIINQATDPVNPSKLCAATIDLFVSKIKRKGCFSNKTVFTLQPGETLPKDALISKFYDLSRPGKYTIQVSRTVPNELGAGTVKSLAITIRITG